MPTCRSSEVDASEVGHGLTTSNYDNVIIAFQYDNTLSKVIEQFAEQLGDIEIDFCRVKVKNSVFSNETHIHRYFESSLMSNVILSGKDESGCKEALSEMVRDIQSVWQAQTSVQ